MLALSKASLTSVSFSTTLSLALRNAFGWRFPESEAKPERIPSGSPIQLIQSTFNQAFRLLSPRLIQLLVEETNSGRMFLWHSESKGGSSSVVNSEEFDHSTADAYLQSMPGGDWILQQHNARQPLVKFNSQGKKQTLKTGIPSVLLESFAAYTTVLSVHVDLGDEWQGRFVVCDPSAGGSTYSALAALKRLAQTAGRPIHRAHYCLRLCRETAAEERSRLARELHDGAIQSILGVELRLESLKRRLDTMPELQTDVGEVQGILRREATELRNLVNDSRRRALRPERLLEFLSDLLERFQRDTGVVTRFFADLQNERMPPRICHEIARMAEEGITNAHRHSKASTLTVRVGSVGNNWVLVIVDDGVGFEFRGIWALEKLVSSGLGPRVIKERVLALQGNLMIESTPNGARIEISIPKSGWMMNPFHLTTSTKLRHDESYSSSNC
jgi:signal transduction histidine kinase